MGWSFEGGECEDETAIARGMEYLCDCSVGGRFDGRRRVSERN